MNMFKKFALAAGLCAASMTGAQTAMAQTTDGFHTIQIFPVVVDSGSFTQRFTFRNRNSATLNVHPVYYPGGGAQTVALVCPDFSIGATLDRTFPTLRDICPGLAAGSEFGFLYTNEIDAASQPYSAFSRVSNPQGNGFSVEAFAGKEFTSAPSSIAGIRRMAATASNPTFQTNCFFGAMNNVVGAAPGNTNVNVVVRNSAGTKIGSTTALVLIPGTLTRVIDVFSFVGAPAGDYVDGRMTVSQSNGNRNGLMSFCTVQDNTSFGADFRIAKQEDNETGEGPSGDAAQSDYVSRMTSESDILTSGGQFPTSTSTNASSSTTHVVYFHHPDWVQCALLDGTGSQVTAAYGLEMRMMANDGVTVVAGGNNSVGWGDVYLGDKGDYNLGADGRYTIEVEDAGTFGSTRAYKIRCRSGSGSTLGEIIRYRELEDRF